MLAERKGLWFGFLGVAGFSLSLPATRLAVQEFDPTLVTLGRALMAFLLAAAALWYTKQKRPSRSQWWRLGLIAAGVVLGFPLLSAWALRAVPASHGAVVLGLLPLFTAGAGALRGGERPSLRFWLASVVGSAAVVGYGLSQGAGSLHVADLALLGAVIAAAIGYAEGGQLAREIGGWQVISWALVVAAPFFALPAWYAFKAYGMSGTPTAWIAFGYIGVVAQFLAFIAWYKGMALGGVARVGQLQLLQPFITLLFTGVFMGETVTLTSLGVAAFVMATVALGRTESTRAAAKNPATLR